MNSKLLLLFLALPLFSQPVTELFSRGYSVIPTPRNVKIEAREVAIDSSWTVDAGRLGQDHIAVRSLLHDLDEFHNFKLAAGGERSMKLAVTPGAVATGAEPGVDRQAYRLRIGESGIEVTGNSEQGLFYGVQTLLQLARRDSAGRLVVPRGVIEDCPVLQLRFLHWDTKHHQDRMETLKRYLDWAARMKVNMIGFELEDKFEYPSHPVIGAPGAFTTAQLQEIVNYGLERYIQVAPVIQAPAHLAYVLKHAEFAHLRADGNNYQSSLCDPRTYDLIFSMYDDVIKATQGVDYLFVSTDEVYYAGIESKCTQPYNPVNRSLRWVEFVKQAHEHLAKRGRRMLIWAEYPLVPEHVKMLSPDIIDGVIGEPEFAKTENELGIRQLAYTPMQGDEKLFPNNFSLGGEFGVSQGRLQDAFEAISAGRAWTGRPIGTFGAAWGDSGLHNETFWLGWSTVAQYGWARNRPAVDQHAAEFMNLYYGPRVEGMADAYRMLQRQARAWEAAWDRVRSRVRGLAYANWDGRKGVVDAVRWDLTLSLPALPTGADFKVTPAFTVKYAKRLGEVGGYSVENDRLLTALQSNVLRADRNRYNLEVLLALTNFISHHWQLLRGLASAEKLLEEAQAAAAKNDRREALRLLEAAEETVARLEKEGEQVYQELVAVYEKSRFPKGQSAGGRKFVHIMDDTKDHWADRTADMSFMMAPERGIGLGKWRQSLRTIIDSYGKR